MCDWDKVFGSPSFNAIILNTKKVIYMNRQTGKEMHIILVKYNVYQQLKADLNMTMPHFDEKWKVPFCSFFLGPHGQLPTELQSTMTSLSELILNFLIENMLYGKVILYE